MANNQPHPTIDIYDEEFNRNLKLAKNLIKQLGRPQDRQICNKWITKLCTLSSNDPSVKKNRNQFFKYMITIIYRGVDERPRKTQGMPQYEDRGGQQAAFGDDGGQGFMSRWSPDQRTYVAVQPMPGKGALVYMAVAKSPELGWEFSR